MGLTMDYALAERVDIIRQSGGWSSLSRYNVYQLRGKEYEGYIVASGYDVDENTRPYYERSKWDLPKGPGRTLVQEDLSAFLLEGLLPREMPARYWTELGQRYGTWIRNLSSFAEYPEEALKHFIEGVKDGYAQGSSSSGSHL